MPVNINPRCPHCGGRLYSVHANKPGIGAGDQDLLPYGYCWECAELFRVTVELERVKPHELRDSSGPRSRYNDPPDSRPDNTTSGRTSSTSHRAMEGVNLFISNPAPPSSQEHSRWTGEPTLE